MKKINAEVAKKFVISAFFCFIALSTLNYIEGAK